MPYEPAEIVARYAAGAASHPNGKPLAPDAAARLAAARGGTGRLGRAHVRDSARREWVVEPRRDAERGRWAVLRPAHGDLEPFRVSADGHRRDAWLAAREEEWQALALLAAAPEGDVAADEELATAAARLVDRWVREAHARQLLGVDDDEDEG